MRQSYQSKSSRVQGLTQQTLEHSPLSHSLCLCTIFSARLKLWSGRFLPLKKDQGKSEWAGHEQPLLRHLWPEAFGLCPSTVSSTVTLASEEEHPRSSRFASGETGWAFSLMQRKLAQGSINNTCYNTYLNNSFQAET